MSIILINYNTKELTLECIGSIYKYIQRDPFEIIVVDNNSQDGSVKAINAQYPMVHIIENTNNVGFGRANNQGAKIAKGEFLFLLNTDTTLTSDAISLFLEFYSQNNDLKIGVIGGRILNSDLSYGWSFGEFNTFIKIIKNFYKRIFFRHAKKKISRNFQYFKVDYVTGANIFIKKKLFSLFNGFDENIFMYFEDEDLQRRLSIDGYQSYIIEPIKIIHNEGSSMPKVNGLVSNSKRIIMDRSMFYYFEKWHGTSYKKISKFLYFFLVALPLRVKYNKDENLIYFKEYYKF